MLIKRKSYLFVLLTLLLVFFITPVVSAQEILTLDNVTDSPDPFSPDSDGIEDTVVISAQLTAAGFNSNHPLSLTCALYIYDSNSTEIAKISERVSISDNSTTALNFIWDGMDRKGNAYSNGTYIYSLEAKINKITASPKGGEINLYIEPRLSVSVSPGSWNIGEASLSSVIEMSINDKLLVVNDGNVPTTYSLNLINPQGWEFSQAEPGENTYVLNACFSHNPKKITWNELNHALTTTPVLSSDIRFAADQTGVGVEPGDERNLWLQFKSPAFTSISAMQEIMVVITANPE